MQGIFLRQTMSLGNTAFQLFCHYYLWCLYREFLRWHYCTFTLELIIIIIISSSSSSSSSSVNSIDNNAFWGVVIDITTTKTALFLPLFG
jgi:hypothetical protein